MTPRAQLNLILSSNQSSPMIQTQLSLVNLGHPIPPHVSYLLAQTHQSTQVANQQLSNQTASKDCTILSPMKRPKLTATKMKVVK